MDTCVYLIGLSDKIYNVVVDCLFILLLLNLLQMCRNGGVLLVIII